MKSLLSSLTILLVATLVLAASPGNQPIDVDAEIARVQKQLEMIEKQSISKGNKVQKQRALLDREIAKANARLREIEKQPADETSKEARGARKSRMRDAILDFVRKMSEIKGLY